MNPVPARIDTAKLEEDLKSAAEEVDGGLTTEEYREHGEYSPKTVSSRFGGWNKAKKRVGLKRCTRGAARSYEVDEEFFDTLGHDSAYVLGYIIADGCIDAGRSVKFECSDRDILAKIKNAMNSEHPIRDINRPEYEKTYYRLRINSSILCDQLEEYGVVPNKTEHIRFPDLPARLLPDFTRGYFDGDGSVYMENSRKKVIAAFTTISEGFLEDLATALRAKSGIQGGSLYSFDRPSSDNTIYFLRFFHDEAFALADFMYNGGISSIRKKERFEELMET